MVFGRGAYFKIRSGGALIQENTVRGNIINSYSSSWWSTITTTSSCMQIAVQLNNIKMSCVKYNNNRHDSCTLIQDWLNIIKMIPPWLMFSQTNVLLFVVFFCFSIIFFSKARKLVLIHEFNEGTNYLTKPKNAKHNSVKKEFPFPKNYLLYVTMNWDLP